MQTLKIQEDKLNLIFKVIGIANARYNSAIVYKGNLLISRGSLLKLCDIANSQTILQKQIGNSQITQINENDKYVVIVNFDGLVTFLDKNDIQIVKCQFRCAGKEIRHTYVDEQVFIVVAEVVGGMEQNVLEAYNIEDLQLGNYKPFFQQKGYYYYPEKIGNSLYVQEYNDPNPVRKSRKQTVMVKKMPIENKLKVFTDWKYQFCIPFVQSDIVCACLNGNNIFYLHNNKLISMFNSISRKIQVFDASIYKTSVLALQKYKEGVIFSSGKHRFSYLHLENDLLVSEFVQYNTIAADIGFCLKFAQDGSFYSYNESGLHYYNSKTQKTFTEQLFDITNCGLSISPDASKLVVGDFVGNVYIFSTQTGAEITRTFIGPPIRAITWPEEIDSIFIGTTDGTLSIWNYSISNEVEYLHNFNCSINCIKAGRGLVAVGNSQGQLVIYEQKTLKPVATHKAHEPIRYEDPKDRQLFGSLQHFAEVWSVVISPIGPIRIATSSQDQTIRIFNLEGDSLKQTNKLQGHEFAVTSVDWQVLKQRQIFVSCSDDKKVMVRNPNKNFQLLYEVETSTIKQWHTLTYLSLQKQGERIFIGSQNGYLFIYNTVTRQFEYANKINLGGIEGMHWNNVLVTCSSDLCLNIIKYQ